MKKLFYAGLVCCLVLGGIIFADEKGEVEIKTKEIKNKSEQIEINLKIPVISGLSNLKIQDKINYNFEKCAMNFKNQIENEIKEYINEVPKSSEAFTHFSASSEYSTKYNENKLLSISIINNEYTGGAHGLTDVTNHTIDLRNGKELMLKDLFKENVNYKKIINEEIKKQIDADQDRYFEDDMGFKGISENQSFYINEGKVVINFGLYEIAPYASGIPEFEIQKSILKDVIKPEFKKL